LSLRFSKHSAVS